MTEESKPTLTKAVPTVSALVSVIISLGTIFWFFAIRASNNASTLQWHESRLASVEEAVKQIKLEQVREQREMDRSLFDVNRKLDILVTREEMASKMPFAPLTPSPK